MDTSGDKPPQYDNSLIVLSFTQKTTKPSQKASYKSKPKSQQVQQSPKAYTHKSRVAFKCENKALKTLC